MHLAKRLAVHGRLSDEDVLADHGHVLLFPDDALLRADEDADSLCVVLGTGDEHLVALRDNGIAIGYADVTVLQDTTADEVAAEELTNLQDGATCKVGVLHDECHAMRCGMGIGSLFLFNLLLLVFQSNATKEAKANGCADDAQDAERIGTGIAVGNGRGIRSEDLIAGFRSRTQAWGVGDGSAKDTHHHGKLARIIGDGGPSVIEDEEV